MSGAGLLGLGCLLGGRFPKPQRQLKARAATVLQIPDEVAVLREALAELRRQFPRASKMPVNAIQERCMSDHGTHYKRPFPSNARGIFPRALDDGLRYGRAMAKFTDDPVRVLVAARAQQMQLDLTNLSRAMGQNGSYLQRDAPRVTGGQT